MELAFFYEPSTLGPMRAEAYIAKARKIYDDIINGKIGAYKFFIKSTLKLFNLTDKTQLQILANFLCKNEPEYSSNDGRKIFVNIEYSDNGKYEIINNGNPLKYNFSFIEGKDKDPVEDNVLIIELEDIISQLPESDKVPNTKQTGLYSIIATKLFWENLTKHNNIVKDPIKYNENNDDELFKPLLKRSFGEYCVDYMYYNNKGRVHDYCDAITLLFFIYLWKSISIGEFYYIENYSEYIKPNDEDKERIIDRKLPAFVHLYPQIYSFTKNFTTIVKPRNNRSKGIIYYYKSPVNILATRLVEISSPNIIKTELLKPLIDLTEQIYEVTVIDLFYEGSERSISRLSTFISSLHCANTEFFIPIINAEGNGSIISLLIKTFDENAVTTLKRNVVLLFFKSSVLIQQIVDQYNITVAKSIQIPTICEYYKLSDEEVNKIVRTYNTNWTNYNVADNVIDPFYNVYKQYKNETINLKELDEYRYGKSFGKLPPLIELYNSNINNAIELRAENSYQIQLISNNSSDKSKDIISAITDFVNRVKKESAQKLEFNYTSPSTYIKPIIWLHNYIVNNENKVDRDSQITLFETLLKYFRRYINLYKDKESYCVPQTYRSYFGYSFAKLDGNNIYRKEYIDFTSVLDYKELDKCIFFASLGYQPFNVKSLESLFHYYNLEFKTIERNAIEQSIETANDATNYANSATKSIKEERGRTLQLVGLLGTFIAFVSSIVGMQKVATDIIEFILFALTFLFGILVFIYCIYQISYTMQDNESQDKTKPKKSKIKLFSSPMILVICLLFIVITAMAIMHYTNNDSLLNENTIDYKSDSTNISIINNGIVTKQN